MTLLSVSKDFLVPTVLLVGCHQSNVSALSTTSADQGTANGVAAPPTPPSMAANTHYYYGEYRITSLMSGEKSKGQVLLLRKMEPAISLLTEIACVIDPSGKVSRSPVSMKIDAEGNTLSVTDTLDPQAKPTLSGTGTLIGNAWNWSLLRFNMTTSSGIKITDSNWLVAKQLIARKEISTPNGAPIMLWEAEIPELTSDEFANKSKSFACPAFE